MILNIFNVKRHNFTKCTKYGIKEKYIITFDKTIFIFGSNLGKLQDIPFLLNVYKSNNYNMNKYL